MNDTCTVCQCYVIVACYEVAFEIVAVGLEVKQRFIFYVFQVAAFHAFYYFIVAFAQNGIQQSFRHDDIVILIFCFCISFFCVYRQDDVGRQCPGCCCPSQEVCVFCIHHFEFCDRGCFFYIFIALSNFVRGQCCTTARAVGNYFVAFVQQAFVPDLFQCPPFGFDIFVMICYIRIIHISPEANTVRYITPFIFIFPYGFLTFCDEGFYAVTFDLIFTIQTQLFFNFQFYGQTVCIPAGFSQNLVALHCFVTRDQVFDGTSQDMTDVGHAVCCRRAIVECEYGSAFSCFDTFAKDIVVFPPFFNNKFSFDEVHVIGDFVVHLNSSLKEFDFWFCFSFVLFCCLL